jgi:hypothetical protein
MPNSLVLVQVAVNYPAWECNTASEERKEQICLQLTSTSISYAKSTKKTSKSLKTSAGNKIQHTHICRRSKIGKETPHPSSPTRKANLPIKSDPTTSSCESQAQAASTGKRNTWQSKTKGVWVRILNSRASPPFKATLQSTQDRNSKTSKPNSST